MSEAVLSQSWVASFFPDSSLNALNGLGVEKCPLGRKVGFGPQLGSETYRHVVGKGINLLPWGHLQIVGDTQKAPYCGIFEMLSV